MLTPDAARYYGRPVYVGTAESATALDEVLGDAQHEARRIAAKGIVRVVVFQPDPPEIGEEMAP